MIEQTTSLPRSFSAIAFLPPDRGEAEAWALAHTVQWVVVGKESDEIWTLFFVRKEGDTAYFPFSYIWNGKEVVKHYREDRSP